MNNLKKELAFVSTLKDCCEKLIEHEKELYAIHSQKDVELVVTIDFHKDDSITMFIDEQPIED